VNILWITSNSWLYWWNKHSKTRKETAILFVLEEQIWNDNTFNIREIRWACFVLWFWHLCLSYWGGGGLGDKFLIWVGLEYPSLIISHYFFLKFRFFQQSYWKVCASCSTNLPPMLVTNKQNTVTIKHLLPSQKKLNSNDCLIQNCW